jgi:hypothetical protein
VTPGFPNHSSTLAGQSEGIPPRNLKTRSRDLSGLTRVEICGQHGNSIGERVVCGGVVESVDFS